MRINTRAATLLVYLTAAASLPTAGSAQTIQCVTPGGNDLSQGIQRRIVEVVTGGTDSTSVKDRAMYQLPKTTASKVVVVTRPSKCTAAAQHFIASTGLTPAPTDTLRFLYVKVGSSRLVVSEISIRDGPPGLVVVYDRKWHELASVAF